MHCTELYCTALFCNAPNFTVLHCNAVKTNEPLLTSRHFAALNYTVLVYTALYFTLLYCPVPNIALNFREMLTLKGSEFLITMNTGALSKTQVLQKLKKY